MPTIPTLHFHLSSTPATPKTNATQRKALLGVQLPHTAATPDGAAVVATTTICHDGGGCLGFVKSKHSGEIDLPERFQQEQMRFLGGLSFVLCFVFLCVFVVLFFSDSWKIGGELSFVFLFFWGRMLKKIWGVGVQMQTRFAL